MLKNPSNPYCSRKKAVPVIDPNQDLVNKILNLVSRRSEEEEYEEIPQGYPIFAEFDSISKKDLDSKGVLFINEEINKESLAPVIKKLIALHFDPEFRDDIQIIINSLGGCLDACWALIDVMGFVKNPVRTVALGHICSAATMIFISGDYRMCGEHTSIMIHQYSDFVQGNHSVLVANRKFQDDTHEMMLDLFLKRSKYETKEEVEKYLLNSTDKWFTSSELLEHGLCEEVSVSRKFKISIPQADE
jgi:ATP-dependent Clp protease protease subunit